MPRGKEQIMQRIIGRKHALPLLVLAFALATLGCFALPPLAHADEEESEGYWEFYRETISENGQKQDLISGNAGAYLRDVWTIWTCEHGRYTESYVANEDVYHTDSTNLALKSGDKVTSIVTYDIPKNIYRDTDVMSIACNLSCEVKKRDVLLDLCQKVWIRVSVQFGDVSIYEGKEVFQEWRGGTLKNAEGIDTVVADINNPNVSDALSGTLRSGFHSAGIMRILVEVNNMEAWYWYRWVDDPQGAVVAGKDEGGSSDSSSDVSGKSEGSAGKSDESAAKQDVTVNTDASSKKGDSGGLFIPLAIIGGLAVVGGALALSRRKGKKESGPDDPDDEKKEQESNSIFNMVLYKDFGDTLVVGAPPRELCARIVEIVPGPEGVRKIDRDDLTRRITVTAGQNMEVVRTDFRSPHRVALVKAVVSDTKDPAAQLLDASSDASKKGGQKTAIVTFAFEGDGANFINHVSFKLAGDPEILFVNPAMGNVYGKGHAETELLIGDEDGIALHFAVMNFASEPTEVELLPKDGDVSAQFELYADERRPTAYMYKAVLSDGAAIESPYGTWPLERKLTIAVSNTYGEHVEATVDAKLWPKGIFFDMRQILPERRRDNGALVDTGDILVSAGTEYNIEGAVMEVGVAYRNGEGVLVVDRPNEPADGSYLRLQPVDEKSKEPLNPSASRVWYLLTYAHNPVYSENERLGTLELKPLLPLVSSDKDAEYQGSTVLSFNDGTSSFDAEVVFGLKGLDAEMEEKERQAEIKRIYRLLEAYRLDDWQRVDAVLSQYGRAAEDDLMRLGKESDQERVAQTATQLVKSVAKIQSIQRLRAIRKMVYEAADVTVVHDRADAQTEAEVYNALYLTACTVRWANDIAFTCWWYALMGSNAAYVEPLMTPLKDWIVGYLDVLGSCMWDDEANVPIQDYFTWESFYDKVLMKCIEGELLALIVSALSTEGVSLATDKRTYLALGGAGCFFFYKNYPKHIKKDPETGHFEFDLWGTLKDTMGDFTMFGVKALVSIVLARKFASLKSPTPEGGFLEVPDDAGTVDKVLAKAFNWFTAPLAEVGKVTENVVTRAFAPPGRELYIFPNLRQGWASLDGNAYLEIWNAFYDACQQKGVDVAVEVANDQAPDKVASMSSGFEAWARSLGTVEIQVPNPDGTREPVEVPYLTAMGLFIDWLFENCGLEFVHIDFGALLPENYDYYPRDELVERLGKIKDANQEVRFLTEIATGTSFETDTSTGIDVDAAADLIERQDGEGISTGIDTGVDTGVDTDTGL